MPVIKGINHQIIEVTDTNSIYYEKAWLVVRPEYARVQRSVLEREARRMIKGMKCPSAMKGKRAAGFWWLRIGSAAIAGAAVSFALSLLIR